MQHSSVRLATAISYALPALSLALVGVTFYVLLPKFYTDTVGISGVILGAIILVSRVWDALLDPALGFLSDRTISRWGRRRPWMVAGVVPLAATFFLLVSPELFGDSVVAVGILTFLFFLFWTAVAVPYQSLGAELSFSYTERTTVLAVRDGAVVVGTLLAVVIPELLKQAIGPSQRELFWMLGGIYGALTLFTVAVCVRQVPERTWRAEQRPRGSALSNLRTVVRNRPFLILLLAYVIGGFGSQLPATLFLFYVQYVLKSDLGGLFLLLYFGVGFLFLPLWVALARRWGKRQSWIAAMAVNAGSFVGVLFLGAGDVGWYTAIVVCSGVGYGGALAIPSSMQADVIDYDEFHSGARREGQITGLWLVANKIAAALGAGLALPLLAWSGYVPNAEQPESALVMLTILYGGVPSLCYSIAIVVASFYPITAQSYGQIRAELDRRSMQTPPGPRVIEPTP